MPQIEIPHGVDTEGVNGGPGQPQVETWLTRDVPNWVGQHFRVIANRNAWATIGYSAGGFVAAMATILHPAQYGAGIVLGGYFRPDFGPFYEPFPPSSPLGRRYDLPGVVAHHPPPVSLWVETSHADALSYDSSAAVPACHQGADGRARRGPANAGHRDSVWIALLPQALQWLGANVRGFHPEPMAMVGSRGHRAGLRGPRQPWQTGVQQRRGDQPVPGGIGVVTVGGQSVVMSAPRSLERPEEVDVARPGRASTPS